MFEVEAVERFEDIKGVIRSRKSKKDGQFIGQKKKDKHWSIKKNREQEKEHKPFG